MPSCSACRNASLIRTVWNLKKNLYMYIERERERSIVFFEQITHRKREDIASCLGNTDLGEKMDVLVECSRS